MGAGLGHARRNGGGRDRDPDHLTDPGLARLRSGHGPASSSTSASRSTGSAFLTFAVLNTDYIVVGHVLGPVALGFYYLAFNVSSWPVTTISFTVRRVSLAGFSRLQHDRSEMQGAFLRAPLLLSTVAFPVCALLVALVGRPRASSCTAGAGRRRRRRCGGWRCSAGCGSSPSWATTTSSRPAGPGDRGAPGRVVLLAGAGADASAPTCAASPGWRGARLRRHLRGVAGHALGAARGRVCRRSSVLRVLGALARARALRGRRRLSRHQARERGICPGCDRRYGGALTGCAIVALVWQWKRRSAVQCAQPVAH